MQRGKFITLEGLDGAGKSTHLAWLENFLEDKGIDVVTTREPGGTLLGEQLRTLLLDPGQHMHAETEALLMFAVRREHLDKVILPSLHRGEWVISDRFTDASFAYQGGGRGVPFDKLHILEQWVQGVFQPDLTLYFDVPIEMARQRVQSAKITDRFEREQDEFFLQVRATYLQRAQQFTERICLVDSSQPLHEVTIALEAIIQQALFE
ncbi:MULTISPECIES: dTMP kinase [Nitrosomonas]|uniref:Thymidylate kinase n=1 Tax=Nitrosomonas communis TaxID=44574 RepID=A0A0F7KHJ3_9PROT|nr:MULTISPECIES: dTMP kinase [Nitrosomonas]AKH38613.1 thymidylate kinase [Nitrosomonas communis]TYP93090.1 dTMP kinase [Nitrosomonas communis]UVS60678.1 dTMP kinase [Nitrosomonas sp. PLL12]